MSNMKCNSDDLCVSIVVDLQIVIVSILRAINIDRASSTSILLNSNNSVLFTAYELLGEVFERMGFIVHSQGKSSKGYFQSALTIYNLCYRLLTDENYCQKRHKISVDIARISQYVTL